MNKYRIAGNFRGVQNFVFFEDAHYSAKLRYRPSSTLKTTAWEVTAPNRAVHPCKQQRDGCKTSQLALKSTRETGSPTLSMTLLVSAAGW